MSAPYIIPFNHQPSARGVNTSGTYTVAAGKYARVTLSEAILPVLNSVALYNTKTITPSYQINTTSTVIGITASNVHRINITKDGNGDFIFINFYSVAPTSTINQLQFGGVGASSSFIFSSPNYIEYGYAIKASTAGSLGSMTVDTCSMVELWLQPGDVLTYNSGRVYYEEYNVIS